LFAALSACSTPPGPTGGERKSAALVRPPPIADRAINLQGQCAQAEDDGFREQATLKVSNNQVQALEWQLWVGKRGSCRFDHTEFRQVQSRPHIEMHARDGSGCKLMVWQDPRRVTLAHAGCEKRCTPGIYDKAWPVMFEPATGRCARL
jgi:hypothetical protein